MRRDIYFCGFEDCFYKYTGQDDTARCKMCGRKIKHLDTKDERLWLSKFFRENSFSAALMLSTILSVILSVVVLEVVSYKLLLLFIFLVFYIYTGIYPNGRCMQYTYWSKLKKPEHISDPKGLWYLVSSFSSLLPLAIGYMVLECA